MHSAVRVRCTVACVVWSGVCWEGDPDVPRMLEGVVIPWVFIRVPGPRPVFEQACPEVPCNRPGNLTKTKVKRPPTSVSVRWVHTQRTLTLVGTTRGPETL